MFKNMVALVTGAVNGLGNATAKRLLLEKAIVIGCDIRSDTSEEECKGHPNYHFIQADTRSEKDITHVLDHIKERHGQLDAVVHCAGVAYAFRTVLKDKPDPCRLEDAARTLNVNVVGTFNVNRLSAQLMSENKPDSDGHRGVLINTSGFLATQGTSGQAVTASTFGAIDSMTLPLSRDLASVGIRAVTISPGLFLTPLTCSFDNRTGNYLESLSVFPHRFGYAHEFSDLVVQTIENKAINGEVIKIDGGLRLPMFL